MSYVTHTVRSPYPVTRYTPPRPHVSEGVQGRTPFLGQGRSQLSQHRATKLWAVWVPFACLLLATPLQTSCVSITVPAALRCASRYTLCAFFRSTYDLKHLRKPALYTHTFHLMPITRLGLLRVSA